MTYTPLVLALLASCTTTTTAPPPRPDPLGLCAMNHGLGPSGICMASHERLRVLTYNVNFGLAGDPEGVAAVASANADIVLLQETNATWEAAFVSALAEHYPFHRFADPDRFPAGGMGILSRFPIESIDQLPRTGGGLFFAWRVVLSTVGGKLQVLNVHLRPPISDGGSWLVGYFSTRGMREQEIAAHAATLDPELPTLVVGDFNEEDGRALGYLENRGFSDAVRALLGRERTWEWPVRGFTLRFQLDHILHDAHFMPLAAQIVEAGRSDHKPVWADLERVPQSQSGLEPANSTSSSAAP